MSKKKRKYFINPVKAIQFLEEAYGLEGREMNFYQIRISYEEFTGFFDWYHTQGTIVASTDSSQMNIGQAKDDETAAILISKYINKKNE